MIMHDFILIVLTKRNYQKTKSKHTKSKIGKFLYFVANICYALQFFFYYGSIKCVFILIGKKRNADKSIPQCLKTTKNVSSLVVIVSIVQSLVKVVL